MLPRSVNLILYFFLEKIHKNNTFDWNRRAGKKIDIEIQWYISCRVHKLFFNLKSKFCHSLLMEILPFRDPLKTTTKKVLPLFFCGVLADDTLMVQSAAGSACGKHSNLYYIMTSQKSTQPAFAGLETRTPKLKRIFKSR